MSVKQNNLNTWFKSGTPWIWMNAGAVSIAVIMTLGLMMVIAVRGLGHFLAGGYHGRGRLPGPGPGKPG